jgi:hypothetical protein
MTDSIGFMGSARPGAKRVTRTGIALVHENEIIYPAAGSEAQAITALEDSRTRIDVYFPIEIEIRVASARPGAAAAPASDFGQLDSALA